MPSCIVLAGHRGSLATCCLVDALHASDPGRSIVVLCVTPWSVRRLVALWRRLGSLFLPRLLSAAGFRSGVGVVDDERRTYLEHLRRRVVRETSVVALCSRLSIPFFSVDDLNSPRTRALAMRLGATMAIYSGGGILRPALLACFPDGVLNVHSGPLPSIRGMSAVEWSLLHGRRPVATVHAIDQGIDTGPVYTSREISVSDGDTLGVLRARTVITGIEALVACLSDIERQALRPVPTQREAGRQYYEMAAPLRAVVEQWLAEGRTPWAPGGAE